MYLGTIWPVYQQSTGQGEGVNLGKKCMFGMVVCAGCDRSAQLKVLSSAKMVMSAIHAFWYTHCV